MRRTFRRRPKSGFTLVELLVVIGIIAVLIAILLPALTAAKRQANATRCASQLREIGNALFLYAGENKGWWPVVRHNASRNQPAGIQPWLFSPSSSFEINVYWYQGLLKYFAKVTTNTQGQALGLADFQNTPLWGCPNISKQDFDTTTSSADFNSGYGMGAYAAYTSTFPPGAANAGPWWAMIQVSPAIAGKYYKQEDYKNAATRGIIADSRSWLLEIRNPGSANPPPQRIGFVGYDPSAIDQFDRYRHGKYPSPAGAEYARTGGKQAFNVLFCDGHVATLSDVREGYRAFRQRYPG